MGQNQGKRMVCSCGVVMTARYDKQMEEVWAFHLRFGDPTKYHMPAYDGTTGAA